MSWKCFELLSTRFPPRAINGARVEGRLVQGGDSIDVRWAKYLQHAVRQEQWPAGTTFAEFFESLIAIIERDENGVYAENRNGRWRLTFVGRSSIWEGLDGNPYIIVKYGCEERRLVTAFQPDRGLAYVEDNAQGGYGIWLRKLR